MFLAATTYRLPLTMEPAWVPTGMSPTCRWKPSSDRERLQATRISGVGRTAECDLTRRVALIQCARASGRPRRTPSEIYRPADRARQGRGQRRIRRSQAGGDRSGEPARHAEAAGRTARSEELARDGSWRAPGHRRRGVEARSRRARRERSEEHTSELQSQSNLVCRLLLEKKKKK